MDQKEKEEEKKKKNKRRRKNDGALFKPKCYSIGFLSY